MSGQYNSDPDLRSSPRAFHLEKGPFFSKDSNTVANLWGNLEKGPLLEGQRKRDLLTSSPGKLKVEQGSPYSEQGLALPHGKSAQEISRATGTAPLFLPLSALRKRIPLSPPGWGRGSETLKMLLISTDRDSALEIFILFSEGGEKRNHLCHSKDTAGKGTPLKGLESYFSWESKRKKLESPFWGWGVCRSDRGKLFHQQSKYEEWKREALTSREGLIASVDKGKAASPIRSSRPVCPNSLFPRLL